MEIKSIKELVEATLNDKQNQYFEFVYGKISHKQAKILQLSVDADLTGADCILDSHAIRHAIKRHGKIKEESQRVQIAITSVDFSLIPLLSKTLML